MKVKRLKIKNVGILKDIDIELNQSLILFYGGLRQGKTTILKSVQWLFGGGYPSDLIRHGEIDASVTLWFDTNSISREWYLGRDGEIKAREISFIKNGEAVKKPVKEIEKFLNPFLLDQDYLRKMGETERKRYFTQLFNVDTSEIDGEVSRIENEARDVRAKVKAYGEIDLTKVKSIDVLPLKERLNTVRANYIKEIKEIDVKNRTIIARNNQVFDAEAEVGLLDEEIGNLEKQIVDLKEKKGKTLMWLKEYSCEPETKKPEPPDTSVIENEIAEVSANQVRVEQYEKNVKRAGEKKLDEKKLNELEGRQKELKKQKIAMLSKVNQTCGIKNLAFDEFGNFTYEGTQAGMLSTSQIMKLSSELSALYPEGLGIDLIDRAESLGQNIFLFVDRAEKEKKTILATIVGEKPAEVPENVGVFVIEDGEVKKGGA